MRRFWFGAVFGVATFGSLGIFGVHTSGVAFQSHAALLLLVLAQTAINCGLAYLVYERHRAFAKAREAEQAFRDLYDNISEGVFRSTLDGRMISANPSLVRLNGYETEAELLAAVNDIASEWYVDPGRRQELHELLVKNGQVANFLSEIYRHKTRERIWISEGTRLVRDKNTGAPLYYDGTVREVTETIRRLELQDRYDKIASIMSGCLCQFRRRPDGSTSLPYASVGLAYLFGIEPEEVKDDASRLFELIHPDDLPSVHSSIAHSTEMLTPWQCEFRVSAVDGKKKWLFGHSVPEREADGSTLWHGYMMDISERKRAEASIYRLAFFDPLTELPNRSFFREKLRDALDGTQANGRRGALLFIDLDDFKVLNDSKGHHVGDRLLRQVADRLVASVREDDVVARLGGDEFVVLLHPGECGAELTKGSIRAVAGRILRALELPFQIDGEPFQTKASVGLALFRGSRLDEDEILKRADLAMYAAKAAGRGRLCFFEPAMQDAIEDRLALSSDLRQALAEGGLSLVYQPQVDRTGRCFGAEALLRWRHPTRGDIAPADAVALAERHGLLEALEGWVLETACATLKSWERDPATSGLQLAVNISAHQLNRGGFVPSVERVLRETGADPTRLSLELTEHVMLDDIEQVSNAMLRLKELGISFALDDFGTGYSSLSYLKRLPIDALKIDRSFVRDLESEQSDRDIVATIVNIAQSLRVAVVAEGVETEMQALLLRQLGCHAYQGYLFAEPMEAAEFVPYVHAGERDGSPQMRLRATN